MASKEDKAASAYLAWLNSLALHEEQLASVSQLKDGLFLLKLLHSMYQLVLSPARDPKAFPMDGYILQAADHWSLAATNLKKLVSCMDHYITTQLKLTLALDAIDAQAIARREDQHELNRLVRSTQQVIVRTSIRDCQPLS